MITYDLHIHTCLTPGASDDMTPQNVIDRAVSNGLDIIAVADCNSMGNMRVAAEYAEGKIAFIPAVEIETSEEVRMVCLFSDLVSAGRMRSIIEKNVISKANKVKSFGHQYIVDREGKKTEENRLLRFPTKMNIEETVFAAKQMGGVAIYGNLNNKGYGVISVLGSVPKWPRAKALEFAATDKGRQMAEKYKNTYDHLFLFSSDAQTLEEINTKETSDDLEAYANDLRDEEGNITAQNFIDWLKSYEGV